MPSPRTMVCFPACLALLGACAAIEIGAHHVFVHLGADRIRLPRRAFTPAQLADTGHALAFRAAELARAARPRFVRADICAAHAAIEFHWHVDGWLRERASNQRRRASTDVQLHRMGCRPELTARDPWRALTPNGKLIYRALEVRYGFATSRASS